MDSPLFSLPQGQPVAWHVAHKNQECTGELIVAERWRGEWGGTLPGNTQFRIVILTRPQDISPVSLADGRIAVCLPIRERALRERPASYLVGEDAPAYTSGSIVSRLPLPLTAQQVFSLPDSRQRFDLLARALLTASDVQSLKARLDAIEIPDSQKELALDRLSILEQLDPAPLLSNPHLWSSLEALIDWFDSRYWPLYMNHHRSYHQAVSALRDLLASAGPELAALKRLNSIVELGQPVGESLFAGYEQMEVRLRPCPLGESPAAYPCPACGLSLTHQVPQREIERFLSQVELALGQQLRRLSSRVIRRILAESREARVEELLKIVQASDLASLVNVLDEELLDFLRRLLMGGQGA